MISAPAGPSLVRTVPVLPLIGLAVLGLGMVVVTVAAPALPFGRDLHLTPAERVLLGTSAIGLGVGVVIVRHRLGRWELLATGLGGLGAQALLMSVGEPLLLALALLLVGFAHAALPGARSFAVRCRGSAFAALLLGLGWALLHAPGPSWLGRSSALALALGVAAAAGVIPYLPDVEPADAASSSYLAWTAFIGPAVALSAALPGPLLAGLSPDQAAVFGSALVGLGLVNVGWGTIGAWRTASDQAAWRYSFLADWGLALIGLGLFRLTGEASALLALVSIVMIRLPLCLRAQAAPSGVNTERSTDKLQLVFLTVMLAGAAPFAGFPIRLLLLQAAAQESWPLSATLLVAMLLWLAHAPRLARTVGTPRGWPALGVWLTMALSVAVGLTPGLIRVLAGL